MQLYELNDKYGSFEEMLNDFGNDKLKLDLGCGYYKPSGYIGIDNLVGARTQIVDKDNSPDIFMDLNNQKLPFEDDTISEVRSSHFLEHSNMDHIIDESHRVLKRGGVFVFTVPYANSAEGMYPGHNIFLTEKWFYENINFQSKFKITNEKYYPSSYWKRAFPFNFIIPWYFARKFLFNTCWQMKLTCEAIK